MLSLFVDEHSGCSKDNKKEPTKQHTCICNAIQVNLVTCQVWSKVKLFHTLFGGYLNHVRQALSALLRIKRVLYYNAMQGTTQAHFLLKLLRSSTLSSLLNQQNVASSSGLAKISAN